MDIEYIVENWRRIPTVLYRKVIIENRFRLERMFSFFYSSPELKAWKSLKNRHQGETLVVVGNGPSLAAIDFKLLSKFTTFGSNKIFLQDQWVPTYYSVEDDLVMVQNEKSIREFGGTTKLFPCSMLSICSRIPNSIYFEFSTKIRAWEALFYFRRKPLSIVGVYYCLHPNPTSCLDGGREDYIGGGGLQFHHSGWKQKQQERACF